MTDTELRAANARGRVGKNLPGLVVRLDSETAEVRVDCHNNPAFWLAFDVPARFPGSAKGRGRVGCHAPNILVQIGEDGRARADCFNNPEFWFECQLPPRNGLVQ